MKILNVTVVFVVVVLVVLDGGVHAKPTSLRRNNNNDGVDQPQEKAYRLRRLQANLAQRPIGHLQQQAGRGGGQETLPTLSLEQQDCDITCGVRSRCVLTDVQTQTTSYYMCECLDGYIMERGVCVADSIPAGSVGINDSSSSKPMDNDIVRGRQDLMNCMMETAAAEAAEAEEAATAAAQEQQEEAIDGNATNSDSTSPPPPPPSQKEPASSYRWVQLLHGLNHFWEKVDEENRPHRVERFQMHLDAARQTAATEGMPTVFVSTGGRPGMRDVTADHVTLQGIENDMQLDASALGRFFEVDKKNANASPMKLVDIVSGATFPYLSVSPTEEMGDLVDVFDPSHRALMGQDGRPCLESQGKIVGSCYLEFPTKNVNSNSTTTTFTKVGLIGLSQRDYLVQLPVHQVRKQVAVLEKSGGVDIIVLLSRNGEMALDLSRLLTGVDIIVWESQRDMEAASDKVLEEAMSQYPMIREDADGFPILIVGGSPLDGSILGNLMVKFDEGGHVVSMDSRSGRQFINDGPMAPPVGIEVNSALSSITGYQWLHILHDVNHFWQLNDPAVHPNGIPRYASLASSLQASAKDESIPSLHISLGMKGDDEMSSALSPTSAMDLYEAMGVNATAVGSMMYTPTDGTSDFPLLSVNPDPEAPRDMIYHPVGECQQIAGMVVGSCYVPVACRKVGIIGLSEMEGLPFQRLLNREIDNLTSAGVDIIILMDQRNETTIKPGEFSGIDVVLTKVPGDEYLSLEPDADNNSVLIVRSTTEDDSILGSLMVKFDADGHVVSTDTRSGYYREVDSTKLPRHTVNDDVFSIVDQYVSTPSVLGKTIYPLNGETKEKNIRETNLGRLLLDAIKQPVENFMGVDIALYQADSILGSIPGPYITRDEILDEDIYVVSCTAPQVLAAISNAFYDFWSDSGRFLQVDGVRVEYDPLFFGEDNLESINWSRESWMTFSVSVERSNGSVESLVEEYAPVGDASRTFTVATTATVLQNFASIASCNMVANLYPLRSPSVPDAVARYLSNSNAFDMQDPPIDQRLKRMPFLWDAFNLTFNLTPEIFFVEETSSRAASLLWKTFNHGPDDCNFQELSFGNEVLPVNIENLIDHGERRLLLRFSTWIVNNGPDNLYYGWPPSYVWRQKFFPDLETCYDYNRVECHFEWGECHGHWHNKEQTYYELFAKEEDGSISDVSVLGRKQAFCMVDTSVYPGYTGDVSDRVFEGCDLNGEPGVQGISAGWYDNYDYKLPGQWVDVTGVPGGEYVLCVTVNYGRIIAETNLDDNTACRDITIPHAAIEPPDAETCMDLGESCDMGGNAQCCTGNCVEESMGDNAFCECVPAQGICWKNSDCCNGVTASTTCKEVDGHPLKLCVEEG